MIFSREFVLGEKLGPRNQKYFSFRRIWRGAIQNNSGVKIGVSKVYFAGNSTNLGNVSFVQLSKIVDGHYLSMQIDSGMQHGYVASRDTPLLPTFNYADGSSNIRSESLHTFSFQSLDPRCP
jgi:hypothetical protein